MNNDNRANIRVNATIYAELKQACADRGIKVNWQVEALIKAWLAKQKEKETE